jgi:hypothetical protein
MDFEWRYDKTLMEGGLGDFPGPIRLHKADETPKSPSGTTLCGNTIISAIRP